jgi:hypothetical protein
MWGDDAVVDDGSEVEGNVVFSNARLLRDLCCKLC